MCLLSNSVSATHKPWGLGSHSGDFGELSLLIHKMGIIIIVVRD